MNRGFVAGFCCRSSGRGLAGLAQPIEHTPAPCMDTEAFPLIEARASSAEDSGVRLPSGNEVLPERLPRVRAAPKLLIH